MGQWYHWVGSLDFSVINLSLSEVSTVGTKFISYFTTFTGSQSSQLISDSQSSQLVTDSQSSDSALSERFITLKSRDPTQW